jgi:predicted AlkP superfamily phosphohydrolase/phosphomutase
MIIALDGETIESIKRWDDDNDLPTLNHIIKNCSIGQSRSVMPPLSPCAWSSILTGKNPGKHGVYGYDVKRYGEYLSNTIVNSSMIKSEALWDIMEKYNKKSIIINFHPTYPPFKINGVMISGLTTPPGISDFVYPADAMKVLKKTGYKIFPKNLKDKNEYIETIKKRGETARALMKEHDWDVFAVLFTCLESSYDIFWDEPDIVSEIAKVTDREVEKLLNMADEDTTIFIISDHGVERQKNTILLNNILMQAGLMKLKKGSKKSRVLSRFGMTRERAVKMADRLGLKDTLKKRISLRTQNAFSYSSKPVMSHVDWSKTKAFSTASGKIYINLSGREPEGIVRPEEKEEVMKEIAEKITNITDPKTGEKIRGEMIIGKDVYTGNEASAGPDMVFWPETYAPETWNLDHSEIGPPIGLSKHSLYGIFIGYNKKLIKTGKLEGTSILDVLPTALYSMGVPVHKDIDGKVLDVFKEKIETEVKEGEANEIKRATPETRKTFTEEEENELKERLKGLGYMG